MRAFDAQRPAHAGGDARRAEAARPPGARGRRALRRGPALLDDAGLRYELDPTLVRGLDYYTRTLFEFTSDALGAQSGVGGGGRYDRLIEQLGGPPRPASGWAAGVERMLLAGGELPVRADVVDLYVAHSPSRRPRVAAAFELAREARRAGLAAQLKLTARALKGQLSTPTGSARAMLRSWASGRRRAEGDGEPATSAS